MANTVLFSLSDNYSGGSAPPSSPSLFLFTLTAELLHCHGHGMGQRDTDWEQASLLW